MKAVAFSQYGAPEVLAVIEAEKPQPKADEVLIRVQYAGLNPMCCKLRAGKFKDSWKLKMPAILGFEVSGTIEEAGAEVSSLSVGDNVYSFFVKEDGSTGGFAEYVAVKESLVQPCPASFSMVQAAGFGLVGVTAWQCLMETAKIGKNDRVLVHSAAGGVGQVAVQLAKLFAKEVIGTASPKNHKLLNTLGCDHVLDYNDDLFSRLSDLFPSGIDVILESMGGDHQKKSYELLAAKGRLVSIVGEDINADELKEGTFAYRIVANPDGPGVRELYSLVNEGKLKPHTINVFAIVDAPLAHEHVESGHSCGKTILKF